MYNVFENQYQSINSFPILKFIASKINTNTNAKSQFMIPNILSSKFQIAVDSISNAGGLGYNALADDESKRWSLVTMIDIPKVEFASCARDLISGWNLTTMNWLRR